MYRRTGLFLLIGVPLIALLVFFLLWLTGTPARAADQIPCWKVNAVMAWALGNEARAVKLARKHGYNQSADRRSEGALPVVTILFALMILIGIGLAYWPDGVWFESILSGWRCAGVILIAAGIVGIVCLWISNSA